MRRWQRLAVIASTLTAVVVAVTGTAAGRPTSPGKKPPNLAAQIRKRIDENAARVEIVSFSGSGLPSVRIVRGTGRAPTAPGTVETVRFGDFHAPPMRVLRGGGQAAATSTPRPGGADGEMTVAFAVPRELPVTVLRGLVSEPLDLGLFPAASGNDLDRVAFAVDGAESSHGTDPGMWRLDLEGPQGPMQVSAAAAADLGGGDRFDLGENRALGRAYLARLYRRYGNWPDAIAAYNWGPGNFDAWIEAGRPTVGLPPEVQHYRARVLQDVGLPTPLVAPVAKQERNSTR
jgi:Transglycosylase SLT domain